VRTLGTGFLLSMAYFFIYLFLKGIIGSFMAPYIIKFSELSSINPYLTVGLISVAGLIGATLINETLNKPLKDEIEELK
jgi:hypothetical protein